MGVCVGRGAVLEFQFEILTLKAMLLGGDDKVIKLCPWGQASLEGQCSLEKT